MKRLIKIYKNNKNFIVPALGIILLIILIAGYNWFNPRVSTSKMEEVKQGAISGYETINESGDLLIKSAQEYQIVYLKKFDQFLISIKKTPFETSRKIAEQDFLNNILKTNKKLACQFNVKVVVPNFVDPELAGQEFSLSFCE